MIGAALESMQRQNDDMEAGERRYGQAETDRGVSQEISNLGHTDGSDYKVMPKPPLIRRCK